MNEKLSWKEKFSSIILLIIGILLLLIQVQDLFNSKADRFSFAENKMSVNMTQFKADIKSYFVILLAIIGGWLLLKGKRIGWIIGLPVLVWYALLAITGLYLSSVMQTFDAGFILMLIGFFLLLPAVFFLLAPSARIKYKVGKRVYLPTVVVLMAIFAMHFLLK